MTENKTACDNPTCTCSECTCGPDCSCGTSDAGCGNPNCTCSPCTCGAGCSCGA